MPHKQHSRREWPLQSVCQEKALLTWVSFHHLLRVWTLWLWVWSDCVSRLEHSRRFNHQALYGPEIVLSSRDSVMDAVRSRPQYRLCSPAHG